MLRTSTLLALIASVALTLGLAGSASATNSLDIVWKTGTCNIGDTSLCSSDIGSTLAAPPATVTALLVLRGDAVGVAGVTGSFLFDYSGGPGSRVGSGNELDLLSPFLIENPGPSAKVGMGNQFGPLTPGPSATTESDGSAYGSVEGFDSVTLATGCVSCTVTLGSALFTTTANTSSDLNADVVFTVEINGSDGVLDAQTNLLTTDNTFGSANVLPEPMAGVFGVSALLALGVLARRRSQ